MDVTFVVDSSTVHALKRGKAVLNEIESACAGFTDVTFHSIEDISSDENQEIFFNADVAILDMSHPDRWCTLSYKLGMRENFGMVHNIIIFNSEDSLAEFPLESATFFSLVKYSPISDSQCVVEPTDLQRMNDANGNVTETQISLRQRITELLQNFQVQAKAHKKDRFLNDLCKLVETNSGDFLKKGLHKLRLKLDDSDILCADTVYRILLAFREIQEYNEMVKLVDDLKVNPKLNFTLTPAIIHLYGFALIRRKHAGDMEFAEKLITSALQKEENQIQEMFCLCGRIYKDKFTESGYTDKSSLQHAIHWYRKGFNFLPDQVSHPGINLATLLFISGSSFSQCPELQKVTMLLNIHLGRKGGIEKIDDYWDVATYFELNLLTKDYAKVATAASCMYKLKPPTWFSKTTLNNVKLIQHFQRKSDRMDTGSIEETVVEFWIDFFTDGVSDTVCPVVQVPILIVDSDGGFVPCYLKYQTEDESSTTHIRISSAKYYNNEQQKTVMEDSSRNISVFKGDKQCLYLYLHRSSEDFQLHFSSDKRCQHFFNLLKDKGVFKG